MRPASPFSADKKGVRVGVRLIPKAASEGIDGVMARADGGAVLKTRVRVAPENGEANAALLKLLAKAWDISSARLAIVTGETSRNKTVHVSGDPAALLAQLDAWLEKLAEDEC